jgi:hypothetical protein
MKNPLTGDDMTADGAAYVEQLKTVRTGAKKAARSGNPAKHFPGRGVTAQVGHLIGAAYRADAKRQAEAAR